MTAQGGAGEHKHTVTHPLRLCGGVYPSWWQGHYSLVSPTRAGFGLDRVAERPSMAGQRWGESDQDPSLLLWFEGLELFSVSPSLFVSVSIRLMGQARQRKCFNQHRLPSLSITQTASYSSWLWCTHTYTHLHMHRCLCGCFFSNSPLL